MILNDTAVAQSEARNQKIVFAFIGAIILITTYLGKMPSGIIGALGIMVVIGFILNYIGDRTPIINQYFGGGAIVVIFGSSYIFHSGIFPQNSIDTMTTFMKSGGFLGFYVASLVTGSIFGMKTETLKKAALKYIPVILASAAVACLLTGTLSMLVGKGFYHGFMFIGLPIMGGGMGAGAVPLVQIMQAKTGMDAKTLMSLMVPALLIGNAIAIIMGGLLNKLGQMVPAWTGNGELIRGEQHIEQESDVEAPVTIKTLATGGIIAISMFFLGSLLHNFINMPLYALMIISIALIKVLGLMPVELEQAAQSWFKFVVGNLTPALLVGVGVVYTNIDQILHALTPMYFVLVLTTVIGAMLGAALMGRLMGFYPIEAAITGGLCMANMGGTGDVAVLAASKRMQLMPFAQISSRIGGAFMLILASIVIQAFS